MNVVMFHSGKSFPSHVKDAFRQLRIFNPTIPVYFITDKEWMSENILYEYTIIPVNKEDYLSEDIRTFEVLFGRSKEDFWTITTTRFMYISNFLNEQHIFNTYHFENDILIYFDILKSNSLFCKLYHNLAITIGGPDKAMTGLMFIKNPKALSRMTSFFISLFKNNKSNQIKKIYNMDMVNEMTLMRAYSKDYPDQLQALPILPFGEWSNNYEEFGAIFDPASWGQYVGGTPDLGPGVMPKDHYIGVLLREHPEYGVIWKQGIPFFKYNGNEVKINNLHIHSKNLYKYTTK